MEITITEDKKNKILIVNAVANDKISKKDAATTATIETYLNNNNIKFGNCLKNDRVCNRDGNLNGEWRFTLPGVKKPVDNTTPSVVSSKGAKRTRKSSKPKDE